MSDRSIWGAFIKFKTLRKILHSIRISVARFIKTGVRYCDFEQTKYWMGRVKQR